MFPLFFAAVLVAVVGSVVTLAYYLLPSRGQHADPRGAATTVARLREQYDRAERERAEAAAARTSGLLSGNPSGLLCGYDSRPTVVIMDLPDAPAHVRSFLDDLTYRRAAMSAVLENESTVRVPALARAA